MKKTFLVVVVMVRHWLYSGRNDVGRVADAAEVASAWLLGCMVHNTEDKLQAAHLDVGAMMKECCALPACTSATY